MITELFYLRIINLKRGSLHKKISGVYTSPFSDTDELKNGFTGPKSFRSFRETGRCSVNRSFDSFNWLGKLKTDDCVEQLEYFQRNSKGRACPNLAKGIFVKFRRSV